MTEPITPYEYGRAVFEAAVLGGATGEEAMAEYAAATRDARRYSLGDRDTFTFEPEGGQP